jgi:hypothetical protein
MATLTDWWTQLEVAPAFGGPRRHLHDLLDTDVVKFLEQAGVLRHGGIAPTYPCTERRGDQCPRVVIQIDGAYQAVCGNAPAECPDLILDESEVSLLTTDLLRLCRIIAPALQVLGIPEGIPDLHGVHRIGAIVPQPGIRYPVYFVIRSNARSYAEALGALVARQTGRPFSMLIPTSRFLTDDIEHQARTMGVNIVALADVMVLARDGLACAVDPATLFASVGQRTPPAFGAAGGVVARALVGDRASAPRPQDLDEPRYQELLARACDYDIFADEKTRSVRKGGKVIENIPVSHFRSIEAAVNSRRHFDPTVDGPELASGKQIFQRARQSFDIKADGPSWKIFKTIRTEEKHAVYSFRPDADVSFAFIFIPEP